MYIFAFHHSYFPSVFSITNLMNVYIQTIIMFIIYGHGNRIYCKCFILYEMWLF